MFKRLLSAVMLLSLTTFAPTATTGCSNSTGPECLEGSCLFGCPCPAGLKCTKVRDWNFFTGEWYLAQKCL